ncbi:MAG: AsmA family protein [Hyphomicrobiaceae bacterium]|nr:AsmA family protein [Hyphomicrobiaceae bacterium]MDX2450328.1 AsmA family protein [Hyphomicrobiaceae bacterium]
MNSLLLTLTALFILVLSALFAAPLFIDWNDYRPAFEAQAAKLLGHKVKVDGDVHLVLLPAPELKFGNVKVANEDGSLDEPFLEAKSLEARLSIGSLFTGTVEAHQLTIVEPVLRLAINDDGTGNWAGVGRPGAAAPFAPKNVLLDSVHVSGGTIEVIKDGVPKFVFANIDGEASAPSLSGPYKVSAEYDFEGRRQTLRLSTGRMDATGKFRLKAAVGDPLRNASYQLDGGVVGLGARPAYDGTVRMRLTNMDAIAAVTPTGDESKDQAVDDAAATPRSQPMSRPASSSPRSTASFLELKGRLRATPDRAELPEFELTVHAHGRPQIFTGNLALDFSEPFKAEGRFNARWIDLDELFGATGEGKKPSPAAVLYMFAEWMLAEAETIGEGALTLNIEQAGLGGDLIGGLDLSLVSRDGGVTIERLKAVLPGDNAITVSGSLKNGAIGPLFAGPIELEGSGLRALTRWAAGDRYLTGQASIGDFSFSAFATVGDGELKLADAKGEVSDTEFSGRLDYQAGTRNLIEVNLDSDRLDLREMLGDGPIWRAWFSANGDGAPASSSGGTSLLTQLRDDDVRATLKVDELLLPNIPPGKLDARLGLIDGTLAIEQLDFAAPGAIALSSKGSITDVADAPSGRVDLNLQAQTTDSLRVLADLFGFPEDVTKSKHLSALRPLDIRAGLVAGPDGDVTRASLDLAGQVGGSDIALAARAKGEPGKPAEAEIDVDGSVTGDRPQALLVLLFPDLPQDRLAETAGSQGTLSVKLNGVPATKLTGRAALETAAMQLTFEGEGALKEPGLSLDGQASIVTQDASLVLPLIGLDAPPSATGVSLTLSADVVKEGGVLDLDAVKAKVGGDAIDGTAHFKLGESKTRFSVTANADRVSLPAVLGPLVAWERTESTEEMLGSVGEDAAEVWPARGFALGIIENVEGDVTLKTKTLALSEPFQVSDATLTARVDSDGLAVTNIEGGLLSGAFTASGILSPRGGGASLTVEADLKGGRLENLSKAVTGQILATGPFDLGFAVEGEGLSPPGVVAGLSGTGSISIGDGTLLALNAGPLRRMAAKVARANTKVTKAEVDADTEKLRETLTKGTYKYASVQIDFEVENGSLRLAPTSLAGTGAETSVNAYLELASLKLDSEWLMRLTGAGNKDVPPVTLVFGGTLDKADEISPAVDTTTIESYLTIRRMQEDVERLETLDVSGKTAPPLDARAAEAEEAAEEKHAAEEKAAAEKAVAESEAAAIKAAAEKAARQKAEAAAAAKAAAGAKRAAEAKAAADAKIAAEKKAAAEAKAAAQAKAAAKAKAETEKAAAKEKAAAEARAIAEAKAEAEAKAAAEAKAIADQAAKERAAAEAKAAAERAAREKIEADAKLAAEKAAKEKAAAEARAAAAAKATAAAEAAVRKAVKARAAAESRAKAERAATARIEAKAAAERAAAKKAAAARAAAAKKAAARAAVPEIKATATPVPNTSVPQTPARSGLSPEGEVLLPATGPDGLASDPIGEMLSVEPATGEFDPLAEGLDAEAAEVVEPAPRRRRPRRKPDDWKKGYDIFGGG